MVTNPSVVPVTAEHADYLRDESRRVGRAESICFPADEAELCAALQTASAGGVPVTLQGARTGITAGAVPEGGLIINLSRMTGCLRIRRDPASGDFLLAVQPGLVLSELRKLVAAAECPFPRGDQASRSAWDQFRSAGPFFFPPDPTEASASVGGMVSCSASGACSFHYGPTRRYIEALRVVLADGDVIVLRRGVERTAGRSFRVTTLGGRVIAGEVPAYRMPAVKNASGLFAADNMDLVDLFIGSEGTLGVFSEVELRLVPAPVACWGITTFFPAEANALHFVQSLRGAAQAGTPGSTAHCPVAIEFFDHNALDLLRGQRMTNPAFAGIPDMPPSFHTAVYVEYHGVSEDVVGDAVAAMSEVMIRCGGSEEATWIATDARELERFKRFRHAVPEAVNLQIDQRRKSAPGLTKLGTDMAVPDAALDTVMRLYRQALTGAGLEHVIFGHIGNNHVHVNILPHTQADYDRGKQLYLAWAQAVIQLGGTVSAEHGIGKLKTALLRAMYGAEGIAAMQRVKQLFDPAGLLNRGNLF